MLCGRYQVHIMANPSRTLHSGVTNDLEGRVWGHRDKLALRVTSKYNNTKLVYHKETVDVRAAIARES